MRKPTINDAIAKLQLRTSGIRFCRNSFQQRMLSRKNTDKIPYSAPDAPTPAKKISIIFKIDLYFTQ